MSVSTVIQGFRKPDAEWKRMKGVWDSCAEAGIPVPCEVEKFFGYEPPDPIGVKVSKKDLGEAVKLYNEEMCEGYEVELTLLPKHITHIRIYTSY